MFSVNTLSMVQRNTGDYSSDLRATRTYLKYDLKPSRRQYTVKSRRAIGRVSVEFVPPSSGIVVFECYIYTQSCRRPSPDRVGNGGQGWEVEIIAAE
jgi:hypothetical protein